MEQKTISKNLRRFRKSRRLTQEKLARDAGLSRVAYRNIETGKSIPRVDTLGSLAQALDVTIQDLVTPVPQLNRIRFRALKRLNSREDILARVARKLADFNELEDLVGDRLPFRLSSLVKHLQKLESNSRRASIAAEQVRKAFGLKSDEPIRDICGLLEAHGIKILTLCIASDSFFGLSVSEEDGGPAIVVNTWDRIPVERWIFSAAHELGHLVLHPSAYDVSLTAEDRYEEKEADVFASYLLMPDDVFTKEWNETYGLALVDRVFKVKRIFRVSYRTVLYRLTEHYPQNNLIWAHFQAAYKESFGSTLRKKDEPLALRANEFKADYSESRRSREPERLVSSDFSEDRLLFLIRRAVEEGSITMSRAAEILGISLLEMRSLSSSWVE